MTKKKASATRRKSSTSELPSKQWFWKINYGHIVLISIVLPFIAWLAGAIINPNGWMSGEPIAVIYYFFALVMIYWLPVLIGIFFFTLVLRSVRKPADSLVKMAIVLLISIFYSVFILYAAATASETEFTG